jgi:hypothetical protein
MAQGRVGDERKERQWRRWIVQWRASGLPSSGSLNAAQYTVHVLGAAPPIAKKIAKLLW